MKTVSSSKISKHHLKLSVCCILSGYFERFRIYGAPHTLLQTLHFTDSDVEFGIYHLKYFSKLVDFFVCRVDFSQALECQATREILFTFLGVTYKMHYRQMRTVYACLTAPVPEEGTFARKYMNYSKLQAEIVNRVPDNSRLDKVWNLEFGGNEV